MTRPCWDDYFMDITRQIARRSTCLRRKVGALLVRDKHILTTGYNGAPRGLPHCEDVGCIRDEESVPSGERHELCRGLHAEMNAMLQAAYHGIRVEGATLYVTTHPCSLCTKMLINVGIRKIIVGNDYPDELSKILLAQAGVEVVLHKQEKQEKQEKPEP